MDQAQASIETVWLLKGLETGSWRWLVFNRDDGSVAEKGPNPGNWEVARPVEICCICSCEVCGCFHSRGLPRAAQVCLEVAPDGCTTAPQHLPTLLYMCIFRLVTVCLLHRTQHGLEQMQLPTVASHCFAEGLFDLQA